MNIKSTQLPEVLLFEPKVFGDARGFFVETFRASWLAEAGLQVELVQDNQSRSRRGVLRGMHYQRVNPQGKLIRCSRGRIFDAAVDIRRGSPTFGRWAGAILDDVKHQQMYIPPGFAHGFVVLSEEADVAYRCTQYYHPASEAGIAWNDPEVGIAWPAEMPAAGELVLAARDQAFPLLRDMPADHLPLWEPRP